MADYLYNGVKLPALPEWNKETYPYAAISIDLRTDGSFKSATLYLFDEINYFTKVVSDTFSYWAFSTPNGWQSSTYFPFIGDTEWGEFTANDSTSCAVSAFNNGWANFDILNEDGSVFLAASDPLPVGTPITDPVSFVVEYQFGCRLRAQRAVKKPIGYLYNGVQLPKIPEVEGYAVIFFLQKSVSDSTPVYNLYFLNQPATVGVANMFLSGGGSVAKYEIIGDGNEWKSVSTVDTASGDYICTAPTGGWSNYDIYTTNGTLFLAASDPVPVYE